MIDWKPWQAFLDEIRQEREKLNFAPGEDPVFRGLSNSAHALAPSLYRSEGRSDEELWQLESDLFFEFKARSRDVRSYTNDWDILFHMRHYGVPTRLLDWSEILGVALAFAVQDFDPAAGKTPCVWILNPWALNEASWGVRDLVSPRYLGWDAEHWEYDDFGEMLVSYDGMPWELPVAIYPEQTNARMAAQRGVFTIHGDDSRPLNQTCKKFIGKVDLSPELVGLVKELLAIMGVDQYMLFPDSDGLSRALADKYRLPGRPEERVSGQTPRGANGNTAMPPTRGKKTGRRNNDQK